MVERENFAGCVFYWACLCRLHYELMHANTSHQWNHRISLQPAESKIPQEGRRDILQMSPQRNTCNDRGHLIALWLPLRLASAPPQSWSVPCSNAPHSSAPKQGSTSKTPLLLLFHANKIPNPERAKEENSQSERAQTSAYPKEYPTHCASLLHEAFYV